MKDIVIRDIEIKDARRVLEIYAYYVKNTAVSFEYDVPALSEFKKRISNTVKKYPYLVIEKNGKIAGYAYAGALKGRAAYDWVCEVTVYIDYAVRKQGLGRKIYAALEKRLKEMGILNLYACIAYPIREDKYLDCNSAEFHYHLGYLKVGEFNKCGYKFGCWYNMIWMEKIIGEHLENQPAVEFSGDNHL